MEEKILQIPVSEMVESLKLGYEEYKDVFEKSNNVEDLGYLRGYCRTIEKILFVYGELSKEEVLSIQQATIGDMRLEPIKKTPSNDDELDIPTYFRNQKKGMK